MDNNRLSVVKIKLDFEFFKKESKTVRSRKDHHLIKIAITIIKYVIYVLYVIK